MAQKQIPTTPTEVWSAFLFTAAFTLDVYGHVTQKMKQESANRMEQFFKAVNA